MLPSSNTPINYTVGAELEFYLLSPEGNVIADLESGKFPQKRYSVSSAYKVNLEHFLVSLESFSVTQESGPCQYEVQFAPLSNYQELALRINEFVQFSEVAASNSGLQISFVPKPLEGFCGSSFHVHYSSPLFDPWGLVANKGVVLMKRDADNEYVLWAIGGMLERMAGDLEIFLPTEESKKRIEPWLNAPTKICWGRNNRSTAIRIPDSKPKRIEHRVCGSDVNFEAALAAIVDAAEHGINNRINPDEPIFGNAWEVKYNKPLLIQPTV